MTATCRCTRLAGKIELERDRGERRATRARARFELFRTKRSFRPPSRRYMFHIAPRGDGELDTSAAGAEVAGVDGMLSAYDACWEYMDLSAPTNMSPIIQRASATAAAARREDPPHYEILLILTDGVIDDMTATKRDIVKASGLPLSIIIVGVGKANFASMEELDGDGAMLRDTCGHVAQRDIVQFVAFREVAGDAVKLAKETLAEVPLQISTYFDAEAKRHEDFLAKAAAGAEKARVADAPPSPPTGADAPPAPPP